MSLLTTLRGSRHRPRTPAAGPLPAPLRRRIQLSSDVLAALLRVEGRARPTLDDIEWADAVAMELARRLAARAAN
jgi:hypothetical protein